MRLSDLNPTDYEIEDTQQAQPLRLSELQDDFEVEDTVEPTSPSIMDRIGSFASKTVDTIQPAVRSMYEGLTMNTVAPIGAALMTPVQAVVDKSLEFIPGTPENIDKRLRESGFTVENLDDKKSTYQRLLDTSRKDYAQMKEEAPITTTTGEIAGGILPAIAGAGAITPIIKGAGLAPKVATGALAGSSLGALSAAGRTDGDNLEEISKDIET
jgi:hypothetical protein